MSTPETHDNSKPPLADAIVSAIPSLKTHWVCACLKRNTVGVMNAIKLHPNSVKRCRVCGATKPHPPNDKLSGGEKATDQRS